MPACATPALQSFAWRVLETPSSENFSGVTRPLVMGRNTLDAFRQQINRRRVADIAQTEDADHSFVLVDHRQSSDLQLLHVPYRLGEVIVLTATMDLCGHHIARRSVERIEIVLCLPFAHDVTISNHSDQVMVLANWDGTDIVISHQFCELSYRGVRADPIDTFVHRVFDFHGGSPSRNAASALHPRCDYTRLPSPLPRCPLLGVKRTSHGGA